MKFVLKDDCGYYCGEFRDSFDLTRVGHCDDVSEAIVFEASFAGGYLSVSPRMPKEGDFTPVAVKVSVNSL